MMTARRLHRHRQRLGAYRYDLLVAMRVINGIERELIRAEWEAWLADENVRCARAAHMLRSLASKDATSSEHHGRKEDEKRAHVTSGADESESEATQLMESVIAWQRAYCSSCSRDQEALLASRNPWIMT